MKVARDLVALGFQVVATKGTAAAIAAAGLAVKVVNKVKDGRPHIADMIKAGEIQLVFTTVDETRTAIADSRYIRTAALAQPGHLLHDDGRCRGGDRGAQAPGRPASVPRLQELHAELHLNSAPSSAAVGPAHRAPAADSLLPPGIHPWSPFL